jgi:hypothetical protein
MPVDYRLPRRGGTPATASDIEDVTLEKLRPLMHGLTSRRRARADGAGEATPPGALLASRPWDLVTLPDDVRGVMTMLSEPERALLYWLARDHYSGAGRIVDGGCFTGGSTLALARGVLDGSKGGANRPIHVYDLFRSDAYMLEQYFRPAGLPYAVGDSFRPEFDRATREVAPLLQVNEGDIRLLGWTGEPIEILFVDVAKDWSINDVLMRSFFSCLIPGRSVVVQQDFVFHFCPWVALTMEHLADYFEYLGFVEFCSTVYLNTRPIPPEMLRVKLGELPLERQLELMDGAIRRGGFSGYALGIMECARAALLVDGGQVEQARALLDRTAERHAQDGPFVLAAVESVRAAAERAGW